MNKFDTMNYLYKGGFAFLAYSAYDVFVEGRTFNGFASNDALSYTVGVVGSEIVSEILSNVVDMNGITGMISKPLLTGIIYMYIFNYLVRPEYETTR